MKQSDNTINKRMNEYSYRISFQRSSAVQQVGVVVVLKISIQKTILHPDITGQ